MTEWAPFHTHSVFSPLDALSSVEDVVATAARHGQEGVGLTDHGSMGGTVRLYRAARKAGILPFPGIEAYLVDPRYGTGDFEDKGFAKANRYHVTLLALNTDGYKELVAFTSTTHTRPRFNRYPRATLDDLAALGSSNIAVLTGCFFGLPIQQLVHMDRATAKRTIETYARWFPNTYVELQDHKIDREDGLPNDAEIAEAMYDIAQEVGLPVIVTQDSHYVASRDKLAHALMKRMVYGGEDDEFPGSSYHLPSTEWMREQHDPVHWSASVESVEHLLEANKVSIPELDTFTVHVPFSGVNPNAKLRKKVLNRLVGYGAQNKRVYQDRIAYELDIIKQLGMAPFFLIMEDTVAFCRRKKFAIEARGSANGSLVCFLLGITQVDPIKWDVDFDRFMSVDRVKPPDIDMDIEDVHQDEVFEYLSSKYETMRIGTWMKLGYREYDHRGGVVVTYASYLRRKAEEKYGKGPAARDYFARRYGQVQDIDDVERVSKRDARALRILASHNAHKSYGVHPAGILIARPEHRLHELVPTMLVPSSDKVVSQYDMEDVEQLGYLKADWLGQSSLRVMRLCQEYIGRDDPTDFTWIPFNDKAAIREIRSGRTDTGIFHFEAPAKAKGAKEMGVRTVNDVILAGALYMPGAKDTGQTDHYLAMRRDPVKRARQKYLHPVFEKHLAETYGAVVFQNQVLRIMQSLGMSVASFNALLKIVKDSGAGAVERNAERMAVLRAEFDKACEDHGIDPDEAWPYLSGYIGYGFNRAHAVGYGIRSYRTAYLKVHYPLEYMSALLSVWAGTKKEAAYVREARRVGIRVLPPHVNVSGVSWTMDHSKNAIRRGLVSIPGIGIKVAEGVVEQAPFTSVEDFVLRCGSRVASGGKVFLEEGKYAANLRKLYDVGAFEGVPERE